MKNWMTFFCIIVLGITACEKDSGPHIVPPLVPDPVSFSKEIQPIFDSYCINCHNETHPYLNLKACCSWYELLKTGKNASYVDTVNIQQSLLYKRLTGMITPVMPSIGPQLLPSEIAVIEKWIEEGAQNN